MFFCSNKAFIDRVPKEKLKRVTIFPKFDVVISIWL